MSADRKPGRSRLLALGALLLGVVALWLWTSGALGPVGPSSEPPRAIKTRPPFRSAFATEQEWLATTIARDIADLAYYTRRRGAPPEGHFRIEVEAAATESVARRVVRVDLAHPPEGGEGLPLSVVVGEEGHLWSPSAYRPLAAGLLSESTPVPPTAASRAEEERLLSLMLDAGTETLATEGDRLSAELTTSPGAASAHGRAAFLLGVLAWRESAGSFTDTRPLLARMTAHLALARALRGEGDPGPAARLAEAMLTTLVGLETEALAQVEALENGATAAVGRWCRMLRVRNTGDWRIYEDEGDLGLLEKLEEFRTLSRRMTIEEALGRLDRRGMDPAPDWGALASSVNFSLESGSLFMPSLGLLMTEAVAVWETLHPGEDVPDPFVPVLNEVSAGPVLRLDDGRVELKVLDWGTLAAWYQRHLGSLVCGARAYQGGLLGSPAGAEAIEEQARGAFSRLTLFPLFPLYWATDDDEHRAAVSVLQGLAERSPELLTAAAWTTMVGQPEAPRDELLLPDHERWFDPPLPSGTLYDVARRLEAISALRYAPLEVLSALRESAPHHFLLARTSIKRMPAQERTVDTMVAVYGDLVDYDLQALNLVAYRSWYDTPAFKRYQGRLCELDPGQCYRLGHRLAEIGLEDEAAAAYRSGLERDRDRVSASNRCSWLVEYYFERGRTEEALALSREAAAVYSGAGLVVHARLLERLGRLEEAEDHYLRIRERYDTPEDVIGFYYRRARVEGDETFEARLEDSVRELFPSGLEELDLATLPRPPEDGVVFRSANDNTERFGLKFGHVIVGVNGFRVRNWRQYRTVRDFVLEPSMTVVAWQGQDYRRIEVTDLFERRFNTRMDDYTP
jgi:tetratricopeptide (TPR) repeat protein